MARIEGLIVATPTPFGEDGRIDFDYVREHLDFLSTRGVDGVTPGGTNGEGPSLSLAERKELFRTVIEHKGDMFVIAGTGCSSLPETIELTQYAERVGADAALVVPPFFFKDVSLRGLVIYYSEVLRSTSLPVLLYNIPQFSAVEIVTDLVDCLSDFPNLLGIKDSTGDLGKVEAYCTRFPQLSVYVGADTLLEKTASLRVSGVISGLANAFPELIRETMERSAKGMGAPMQQKVDRLTDIFSRYPIFASNKYALALRGLRETYVRPPLVDLTEDEKRSLQAELRQAGLIS